MACRVGVTSVAVGFGAVGVVGDIVAEGETVGAGGRDVAVLGAGVAGAQADRTMSGSTLLRSKRLSDGWWFILVLLSKARRIGPAGISPCQVRGADAIGWCLFSPADFGQEPGVAFLA